jgi:hypothetical protein
MLRLSAFGLRHICFRKASSKRHVFEARWLQYVLVVKYGSKNFILAGG